MKNIIFIFFVFAIIAACSHKETEINEFFNNWIDTSLYNSISYISYIDDNSPKFKYYNISKENLQISHNNIILHDSLINDIYYLYPRFFSNYMMIDTGYSFTLYSNINNIELNDSIITLWINKKEDTDINKLYQSIIYKTVGDLNLKGNELIRIKGDIIKQDADIPLSIIVNIKDKYDRSFFYEKFNASELNGGKQYFVRLPSYITNEDILKIYIYNSKGTNYNYKNFNCTFYKLENIKLSHPLIIPCCIFNNKESANGLFQWNKTDVIQPSNTNNNKFIFPADSGLAITYRCSLFELQYDSVLHYNLGSNIMLSEEAGFDIVVNIVNKKGEIKYSKTLTDLDFDHKPYEWNNFTLTDNIFNLNTTDIFSFSIINKKAVSFNIKDISLSAE